MLKMAKSRRAYFQDFVKEALSFNSYPQNIFWADDEHNEICIRIIHKSNRLWSAEDARMFEDYGKLRTRNASKSDDRHRFLRALYKSPYVEIVRVKTTQSEKFIYIKLRNKETESASIVPNPASGMYNFKNDSLEFYGDPMDEISNTLVDPRGVIPLLSKTVSTVTVSTEESQLFAERYVAQNVSATYLENEVINIEHSKSVLENLSPLIAADNLWCRNEEFDYPLMEDAALPMTDQEVSQFLGSDSMESSPNESFVSVNSPSNVLDLKAVCQENEIQFSSSTEGLHQSLPDDYDPVEALLQSLQQRTSFIHQENDGMVELVDENGFSSLDGKIEIIDAFRINHTEDYVEVLGHMDSEEPMNTEVNSPAVLLQVKIPNTTVLT